MQLGLSGKTALVTGASAGLGAAIARCLAREGVRLAITARRASALLALSAELGMDGTSPATVIPADAACRGGLDRLAAEAQDGLGQADILVNCAGACRPTSLEGDDALWDDALALNSTSIRRLMHRLVQGRLASGAALLVEVAGGRPPETPFHLKEVGETGVLRLEGGAARGFQSGRLALLLDGLPQHADEGELAAMPDAAANVAGFHAALRDDIAGGTFTAAGFNHAARLTRLVADLLGSSRTGSRRPAAGWPER